MKKVILLIIVLATSPILAQDMVLKQPFTNPLALNPAFTGGSTGKAFYATSPVRIFVLNNDRLFRYADLTGLFLTADLPLEKLRSGVGVQFNYVDTWFSKLNSIDLSYAYSLNLGENISLRGGTAFSVTHHSNELIYFPETGPGGLPYKIRENFTVLNLEAGALLTGKRFSLGLSAANLLRPNVGWREESPNFTPVLWQAHTSYTFGTARLGFSPYIIYYNQGSQMAVVGTAVNYKFITTGAGIVTNDQVQLSAGINLKNIRVHYSAYPFWDTDAFYSHEISLALLLPDTERNKIKPVHNPLVGLWQPE